MAATAIEVPFGDAADFDRHGTSLAEEGSYPDTLFAAPESASALRPPGLPFLLAGIFKVFGHDLDAARVVNALLGVAAVVLVYLLVARVLDRRTALVAAAIAAVAPSLVFVSGALLSENLFIPLALATALLVALQRERGGWPLAVAAGFVLGLAVLTRTNGLLLVLPLLLGLRGNPQRALAVVALAAALVPWTVRNYAEFDRFLPLGTQSGFTMAGQWNGTASSPGPKRAEWLAPFFVASLSDLINQPGLDEGDVDSELRERALDYAVNHPTAVVQAVAINVQRTFSIHPGHSSLDEIAFEELAVPPDARQDVLRIGGYVLALLALAGAVVLVRRRAGPLWLWLFPVLLFAGYVVWLGTPRYRIPVDAFLVIPAAVAVVSLAKRRQPEHPAPGSS